MATCAATSGLSKIFNSVSDDGIGAADDPLQKASMAWFDLRTENPNIIGQQMYVNFLDPAYISSPTGSSISDSSGTSVDSPPPPQQEQQQGTPDSKKPPKPISAAQRKKNSEAARLSRIKKKQRETTMQETLKRLTEVNRNLQQQLEKLGALYVSSLRHFADKRTFLEYLRQNSHLVKDQDFKPLLKQYSDSMGFTGTGTGVPVRVASINWN